MNTLARDYVVVSAESIYTDPAKSLVRLLREQFNRMLALAEKFRAVAKQRRALAELDDAQLRDIGITHEQAQAEASKPFWE